MLHATATVNDDVISMLALITHTPAVIFSRFHVEELGNLQLLNRVVFEMAYFRYRYIHEKGIYDDADIKADYAFRCHKCHR